MPAKRIPRDADDNPGREFQPAPGKERQSASPEGETTQTAGDAASESTPRTSSTAGASNSTESSGKKHREKKPANGKPFPPETLANLAVHLLHPGADWIASSHDALLSDPEFDRYYLGALKRAEFMLETAAGRSDQDVHAYQLFKQGADAMTVESIAGRFDEVGWKGCSHNTLRNTVVDVILSAANERIEERLKTYQVLLSSRAGYPVSVGYIEDSVRNRIVEMIHAIELSDIVPDIPMVSEKVAQYFMRLISADHPLSPETEQADFERERSYMGCSTFIKYVCNGLTFERFIGDSPNKVSLNADRLDALVFFFGELANSDRFSRNATEIMGNLRRMTSGRNPLPPEVVKAVEACHLRLQSDTRNSGGTRSCAKEAWSLLKRFQDKCYLDQLEKLYRFGDFLTLRSMIVNATPASHEAARVREPVARLMELMEAISTDRREKTVEEMRGRLTEIARLCNELPAVIEEAGHWSDGLRNLVPALKIISANLSRRLDPEPMKAEYLEQQLSPFTKDLKPFSGAKPIRPFELFLFAAQEGLLRDKLVCRLSSLKPGFLPEPPVARDVSILDWHGGTKLYGDLRTPVDDYFGLLDCSY